jgi:hypothetical protein
LNAVGVAPNITADQNPESIDDAFSSPVPVQAVKPPTSLPDDGSAPERERVSRSFEKLCQSCRIKTGSIFLSK